MRVKFGGVDFSTEMIQSRNPAPPPPPPLATPVVPNERGCYRRFGLRGSLLNIKISKASFLLHALLPRLLLFVLPIIKKRFRLVLCCCVDQKCACFAFPIACILKTSTAMCILTK